MTEIYERFDEYYAMCIAAGRSDSEAADIAYEQCEADAAEKEAYMIDNARELA